MDREAWTLRSFNRKRNKFGADVCSVFSTAQGGDGFGGFSATPTSVASDIPCFYEPLSQSERLIAGGESTTFTHKVTMEATPVTLAIQPSWYIVVQARGDNPEKTFENPTSLVGSFAPLMEVAAAMRVT